MQQRKYLMSNMPNKLRLNNGILEMQDGSDVVAYLRGRPMKDADSVVLLTRDEAERLATEAHAYRMSLLVDDERFALAA